MTRQRAHAEAVLRELRFLLTYAGRVYAAYLNSGKQFLYAKLLYEINAKTSDLLTNRSHVLTEHQSADSIELLLHLEVWSALWRDAVQEQEPSLRDVFAFENNVNFPKDSVDRLLNSDA